jgi:uncharacterized protein YuzE
MKLHYFPDTDTLSISLLAEPSVESEEIADDVVVDFAADGRVVAIDIDHASKKVELIEIETHRLPIALTRATA